MIKLEITGNSMAEITAQLYEVLHGVTPVTEKPVEAVSEPEAPEPKKAKKRSPAPSTAPLEPIAEVEEEVFVDEAPAPEPEIDLKAVLALKATTLTVLQQAFAEGKKRQVRELLANYGDGAKSFPEVDPAMFPKINEAIQSGALN